MSEDITAISETAALTRKIKLFSFRYMQHQEKQVKTLLAPHCIMPDAPQRHTPDSIPRKSQSLIQNQGLSSATSKHYRSDRRPVLG